MKTFRHIDKQRKREEAEARTAKWQELSLEQQLEELDKRFGKGKGAAKQRARIARKIYERENKRKSK